MRNLLQRMKYSLIRFMSGRYGTDKLNNFLLYVYLAVWILNILIRNLVFSLIFEIIMIANIIIIISRTLSKNIYKRQIENSKYIKAERKIKDFFKLQKSKWADRKTHAYKKCPQCKAVLRLRKISGEHTARCPKCNSAVKVKFK